jgi:arylformamidase
MRIHDITRALEPGMPTWPGEPGPELKLIKQMSAGQPADVSDLSLGVHTGTHVDAPKHFIAGAMGVESLPLSVLVGPAQIVRIEHPTAITVEELEATQLAGVERVLFRTRNSESSRKEFNQDFVYMEPEAAEWLLEHGARLVGVDYLSVEQFSAAEPRTHRILLGGDVVIVEGLDLAAVDPGYYLLCCLPLKLLGADGAPARAVLISD